jgi:hypothetical protein
VVCVNGEAVGTVFDGGENAPDFTPFSLQRAAADPRRTPQTLGIDRARPDRKANLMSFPKQLRPSFFVYIALTQLPLDGGMGHQLATLAWDR